MALTIYAKAGLLKAKSKDLQLQGHKFWH